MTSTIYTEPQTPTAFAPFGDALAAVGAPEKMINRGLCGRFNDRATLYFGDARVGLSIFQAQLRSLRYTLDLIERHPEGQQAVFRCQSVRFRLSWHLIVSQNPARL